MKHIAGGALALFLTFPAIAAEIPPLPVTSAVVPVAELSGATPAAVSAELGAPTSCEKSKYGRKCLYEAGAIEVVFIGGAADWFTIYPKDAFMTASSLRQLRLPVDQKPAAETADVMRWDGLGGVLEVSAYAGQGGRVSYFYIKTRTP